jgi:hypothetical protein
MSRFKEFQNLKKDSNFTGNIQLLDSKIFKLPDLNISKLSSGTPFDSDIYERKSNSKRILSN